MSTFEDSVACLGDTPPVLRILEALVHRAISHPEHAPPLPGMHVRMLRTRSYDTYPALRLFYWFDSEAVHLVHVEIYDELE